MHLSSAAAVQKKLLKTLACPVTRGPIEVLPLVTAAGAIREAVLYSPRLGGVAGQIRNFQLDFVRYPVDVDLDTIRKRLAVGSIPIDTPEQPAWQVFGPEADIFAYHGEWFPLEDTMACDPVGASAIEWFIDRPCRINFQAHPWSGHAEVLVDGVSAHQIDLFEPHTDIPRSVVVRPGLEGSQSKVTVRPMGSHSPLSMGQQCLFRGCEIDTGTTEASRHQKKLGVRGADFTEKFYDMLADLPPAGSLDLM